VSRELRTFVVYGFSSVHDALGAESVLNGAGVPVTPVPSPKEIGELCGIALRVAPEDDAHAQRLLEGAGTAPRAVAEIRDY
jgi:Protein of unknown function (DUF3343)